MLVLNNLPNVQILNGRSTKDDDDEEEEENGDEDLGELNEIENNEESNINNKYSNEISSRLNHLYPKMEEIEEYKNSENNSNYISDSNHRTKTHDQGDNMDINENNENINNSETDNDNNNFSSNREKDNINNSKDKEKKATRNKNVLNENEFNPKVNSNNNEQNISNATSQNKPNTINSIKKKTLSPGQDNNNKSKSKDLNSAKLEKERESFYEYNNSNNEKNCNFLIDITNEELNSLKDTKYNENSSFVPLIKDFYDLINTNKESNIDADKIKSNYLEKLKSIENKKSDVSNYYYFYLLNKKKMKIIYNMYNELITYIIQKNPELNKNNILKNLNEEFFNTIKESKNLISNLHSHIESYVYNSEKKNEIHYIINKENINNNENIKYAEIIKEKDKKISTLESIKEKLLKSMKEDSETYEKKISNLEAENKIMTEKILSKANTVLNSTITIEQGTILDTDKKKLETNISTISKMRSNNNNDIVNQINQTGKNRSPVKLTETNTLENINTINYLNTHTNGNILITNGNMERRQIISLKTLKDLINEIYISKENYDIKCEQYKIPKETLEEHMYTFLNKKYGLKNLIIEWAKNIIAGIKYYSKKDSIVLLFGKIMRNEQEEKARYIIQQISESIEELLLYYIKRQNPLKLTDDIEEIFKRKKNSELLEEEWKGIIYTIYEKKEAEEIEKKIEAFINKEIDRKKAEMLTKYKNSRLSHQNNNNYVTSNNSYYLNTINSVNNMVYNSSVNYINNNFNLNNSMNYSYMNTFGNVSNKLSRMEKYNLFYFTDEKNILYSNFMKIILDNHIRLRDKQLKNFVDLFKSVDTNRDGIINEDEFSELIQKMKIFKEDELENVIFQYLEKIDPYDYQKFTFSECINFFSTEYIQDKDSNGEEKEISVLEKVCYKDNQDRNGNNIVINNQSQNENDKNIEFRMAQNNINEENENENRLETNNNQ